MLIIARSIYGVNSTKMKSPEICPECGHPIQDRCSRDIQVHFQGHITQIARETAQDRRYVYWNVLLKAIQIEVDGGDPYPCDYVDDMVYPYRTSLCTNKQMMTAVEAAHMYAVQDCYPAVILREKDD